MNSVEHLLHDLGQRGLLTLLAVAVVLGAFGFTFVDRYRLLSQLCVLLTAAAFAVAVIDIAILSSPG